ncbi:hypothetical protein PM082_011447 [Marasmius tenuissimus]|nr:hypothetical protein PM082_011447 [Marasmius tenuissimus]
MEILGQLLVLGFGLIQPADDSTSTTSTRAGREGQQVALELEYGLDTAGLLILVMRTSVMCLELASRSRRWYSFLTRVRTLATHRVRRRPQPSPQSGLSN